MAEESIEKIRWRKNKVISGKWLSVYTGNVLTNSRKLDIDHLVPLFEAWQSGGCKWTKELKRTYYNDMNNSNHLVAVEATINRKKSAKDLAEWLPGVNQLWYIESWVEIKRHWGLTVDNKEAAIISNYGVKLIGLKIEPEETRCW